MKRKLLYPNLIKQTVLAVPAAALMLGASQAGTTVGLNFQAWYYDSGTTPQTVGYGAGYQTTGVPVTAKAFGVEVADWTNSDPLDCNGAFTAAVPFGGSLSATVTAANMWQSGYTAPGVWGTPAGDWYAAWPPGNEVLALIEPGDYQVTWGLIDNTGWSLDLTGMAAKFPNGYVLALIGSVKTTATSAVAITNTADSTSLGSVAFTVLPDGMGLGSSEVLTSDAISLSNPSRPDDKNCALGGLIITDKPVVSQKPLGGSYNAGTTISLSGSAIGIPPIAYQWQHAGTNLPGATTTSYVKAGAGEADAGSYQLVASNQFGFGTSVVAAVTVVLKPAIVKDIQSRTNYQGLTQRFAVNVGGQPPLVYQWSHAGTNLPGQTSSALVLNNLQASQAGTYQVIITNTLGAATSSVATLSLVSALPYEGFAYADGDLGGLNGGVGWGAAWTVPGNGSNAVVNPGSTYQDLTNKLVVNGGTLQMAVAGTPDYISHRQLAGTIGGGGTVYLSFIGQFVNSGWEGIWLEQNGVDKLFIGQGWYETPWGFGSFPYPENVSTQPSTALSFVVCRFDYTDANTQVRLYVNPTLANEPAVASASGNVGLVEFDAMRLAAHNYPGPSPNGVIDELRIGGTWASVTPNAPRTDPPVMVRDVPSGEITIYSGMTYNLTAQADGAPPLTYHWKRNGSEVASTTSGSYAVTQAGNYTVSVSNPFGSADGTVTAAISFTTPPAGLPASLVQSQPVAYYPLNETIVGNTAIAMDYAGGNNGNAAGVASATGPVPPAFGGFPAGNKAYEFDGATAAIVCGQGAALAGKTDFSVGAWIQTTASGSIIQQRSGYDGEYVLSVNSRGRVGFMIFGNGDYQYSFQSSRIVTDGAWHQVTAIRSGTNGYIYVDGSLVGSSSGPVRDLDPSFTVAIGYDARDNASYFKGRIDEVTIHNRALSAGEVAALVITGFGSQMQISWANGGCIADTKPQGTLHHGLNYYVNWLASSGPDGAGVTRTGIGDFATIRGSQIVIPAAPEFNSPTGTIFLRVRANITIPGPGTEGSILFDRRTDSGAVLVLQDDGSVKLQCAGGANTFAAGNLADGNWHDVVLVYEQDAGGSCSFYWDGTLALISPNAGAWSWPAAQQIELGRSHDSYWKRFDGQMDEFRMYNRALTPAEIASITASSALVDPAALQVQYPFTTAPSAGRSLVWKYGTLQSSTDLSTWTAMPDATSPYAVLATEPVRFYQLSLP